MSAPHIYHSALPLSPQTSIIRELYKKHASPFLRVVQGMPVSWEPTTATAYIDDGPSPFAWSPCNRLIAVVTNKSVEVLDAATLSSLGTFEYFDRCCGPPFFSPDSRSLVQFVGDAFVSWDLQTGAPLGVISEPSMFSDLFSLTYSNDGKAIAVAYTHSYIDRDNMLDYSFSTYDLHSLTHTGTHRALEGKIIYPIWTHDEHFRFAIVDRDSIRIWQSPFNLKRPPVEVESLPVPDKIGDADNFLFLPSLSRLAFTLEDSIQIWDAKASKLLLESEFKLAFPPHTVHPLNNSFSSDGRFFVFANTAGEVHVWKESPTGYVFHQRLPFRNYPFWPQFSPNGESIIVSLPSMLHRWRTRNQVLSLPSTSTRDIYQQLFALGFSPDQKFAVFVRLNGCMVTVVDLQSGEQRWITDMGVEVDCLGMTEDTVVVVGEEKIATWNLAGGDCTFHTNMSYTAQTDTLMALLLPLHIRHDTPAHMSISPDLGHIVVTRNSVTGGKYSLEVYDVPTGRRLTRIKTAGPMTLSFTQDGHEVWAGRDDSFGEHSKIIEDSKGGTIELQTQTNEGPSRVILRESPHGHEVRSGGWVLSPTRKHLLWLPHHWRSRRGDRVWGGQFLGLLHRDLPEVVILEFLE